MFMDKLNNHNLADIVQNVLDDLKIKSTLNNPLIDVEEYPIIGENNEREGEIINITSLEDILSEINKEDNVEEFDDDIDNELKNKIEDIIRSNERNSSSDIFTSTRSKFEICAWYCPIHYYHYDWGIYIKEDCIKNTMLDIARLVNYGKVKNKFNFFNQLKLSAFYFYYLHEQFHHRIESFGLRLLISSGKDSYLNYKKNVYRKNYLLKTCLEESLANASSFNSLNQYRYTQKLDKEIIKALKNALYQNMSMSPPGYREGIDYISDTKFKKGLKTLQSQILYGVLSNPSSKVEMWEIAKMMSYPISNIKSEIYTILSPKSSTIFSRRRFDPRYTVSTNTLISALKKYYKFSVVKGGKGSHVKLRSLDNKVVILSGNRKILPIKDIKDVIKILGGRSISELRELINGNLQV